MTRRKTTKRKTRMTRMALSFPRRATTTNCSTSPSTTQNLLAQEEPPNDKVQQKPDCNPRARFPGSRALFVESPNLANKRRTAHHVDELKSLNRQQTHEQT